MIIVILFALGMIVLGGIMALQPMRFANGIETFSQKKWFHLFEIISRFVVGVLFMLYAHHTEFYELVFGLGVLLVGVSLFLVIIGEKKHKRFAMETVKIGQKFRPIGMIAILAGVALLYVALK